MTTYAHKLVVSNLSENIPIHVRQFRQQETLRPDDPAIKAMTDLKQVRAVTVKPDHTIDFALKMMKQVGVRLLVVIDDSNVMIGLVTVRDITGEKPMKVMSSDRVRREEILVSQVMTPRYKLDAFDFASVEHASVREVVQHLRHAGRQHGIVIEQLPNDEYFIRGIFSITQIGRQLGAEISVDGHVQSFAELEQLIA